MCLILLGPASSATSLASRRQHFPQLVAGHVPYFLEGGLDGHVTYQLLCRPAMSPDCLRPGVASAMSLAHSPWPVAGRVP